MEEGSQIRFVFSSWGKPCRALEENQVASQGLRAFKGALPGRHHCRIHPEASGIPFLPFIQLLAQAPVGRTRSFVGDQLTGLEGKLKILRDLVSPFFEGLLQRRLIKGLLNFHHAELSGIPRQAEGKPAAPNSQIASHNSIHPG